MTKEEMEKEYNRAKELEANRERKKVPPIFIKLAELGHVQSQWNMSLIYWTGWFIKQDKDKSIYWLTKAANQGYAKAQWYLGYHYMKGKHVEQDYDKAVYWLTKAAHQGYADAQCDLGRMYAKGKGVKQSYEKAFFWYTKAAEQECRGALGSLAWYYEYGIGGEKDHGKAIHYWKLASKQGCHSSAYHLKKIEQEGNNKTGDDSEEVEIVQEKEIEIDDSVETKEKLDKNFNKALALMSINKYKLAFIILQSLAQQDHIESYYILGKMYLEGKGVEQDGDKAVYWYTKAADRNHSNASCVLGLLYYRGEYIEKDHDKAMQFWLVAAQQNHWEAQLYLKKYFKTSV